MKVTTEVDATAPVENPVSVPLMVALVTVKLEPTVPSVLLAKAAATAAFVMAAVAVNVKPPTVKDCPAAVRAGKVTSVDSVSLLSSTVVEDVVGLPAWAKIFSATVGSEMVL